MHQLFVQFAAIIELVVDVLVYKVDWKRKPDQIKCRFKKLEIKPSLPRVSKFFKMLSRGSSPSRTRFAALLATFVRGILRSLKTKFAGFNEINRKNEHGFVGNKRKFWIFEN